MDDVLIKGLTRTQQNNMILNQTEISGHDRETVRILLREYMRFYMDADYEVKVSFTDLCMRFNPKTAQTPLELSIAKLIEVEHVA